MQDFTSVPAVVDWQRCVKLKIENALAAIRRKVNPLSPVDLVISHSVTIDHI